MENYSDGILICKSKGKILGHGHIISDTNRHDSNFQGTHA